MRADFLPFCRPSITEDDVNAVAGVLRSGWITTGPKAAELESLLVDRTGAAAALAITSATAGLHLVLKALEIGPGDEVITPSMTWVSTANLIELAGATPVFVDVDRDTLLVAPEAVEAALTERTKLIVPVHFAGAPVDLDRHKEIAERHNVALVEDAAHTIGARYKGREIGSGGTAIFSLHPIKNITSGEGGVVVSDDAAFIDRLRRLSFHGLGANAYERAAQGRSPHAEVQEPGYKYNMPDVCAVLGVSQLARLDEITERRREIVSQYHDRFESIDEILPLADPEWAHDHSRSLFIVRVDKDRAGLHRDTFVAELKKRNIGAGIHFRAVHEHHWYRQNRPVKPGTLRNTEWNSACVCSLPLFPDMTDDDVVDVVNAVKEILVEYRTAVAKAS